MAVATTETDPYIRRGDTGHQRGAPLTPVHMLIEGVLFARVQHAIQIIAKPHFGLFAGPVHHDKLHNFVERKPSSDSLD